ncbi:hypothetical protein B0H16DRAFT_1699830 [Mycena metata]|uniref:F-box domain-containing protein n=1 Tax=Mycena metata TaxID=1033252 RepID=A0AAD7MJV6_9AGAR|nr:hypothetical protein B0H16DRAFT_1699830 [Mycena metata]
MTRMPKSEFQGKHCHTEASFCGQLIPMTTRAGAESMERQRTQSQRNWLAADRVRIAVIEGKILELKRSISFLQEEKDFLQDRLDAYAYPVLTLPNELVSEIFLHFLPVYPGAPPIVGRSSPNLLGQICRRWRGIAFSTPALWRGISMSLRSGRRLHQKLLLLETWLQRSGSCPLSIRMDLGHSINQVATLEPFLVAITAHSARWQYLQLYSPIHPFPTINTPLPFLRTLFIAERNYGYRTIPPVSALPAAPLLQNLALSFWREHYMTFYPWAQLTTFTAYLILPRECVDVLSHTRRLIYCNLLVSWQSDGATPLRGSPNVTLPYIETFILRGRLCDDLSWRFIDCFTLPAVRTLQVAENLLQEAPVDGVLSLISRSRCNLQKLSITEPGFPRHPYHLALPTRTWIAFDDHLGAPDAFLLPTLDEEPSDDDSEGSEGSDAHSEIDEDPEFSTNAV